MVQTVGYLVRHHEAVRNPDAAEKPIVDLVQFLRGFRVHHDNGSDRKLAEDSYSGNPWLEILKATRTLLSADIGKRLDLGILDAFILVELEEAGFSESDL